MKYKVFLWALFLCCLSFARCAVAAETSDAISQISLERTSCLGMCPADKIVLRSDGTALYFGLSATPRLGAYIGQIEKWNFNALAQYLESQQFFSMENVYPNGPPETDGTFISVTRGDHTKTINFFGNDVPAQWGLSKAIQGVASEINWQKPDSGVRGTLLIDPQIKEIYSKTTPKMALVIRHEEQGRALLMVTPTDSGAYDIALPAGAYFIQPSIGDRFNVSIGQPQVLTVEPKMMKNQDIEFKLKINVKQDVR